jgi:PRTRC genetic system protein A
MMPNLVNYQLMKPGQALMDPMALYDYVYAANGTFIHAKNDIFDVTMPLSIVREQEKMIRGLVPIQPAIKLPKRVPATELRYMVKVSRGAIPNEILFYFRWVNGEWEIDIPPQKTGHAVVLPLEDGDYAPIEVHSHNSMPALFSKTDNRDENGLRIYGVLGRLDNEIVDFKLRISIYGHYSVLPYQLVFEPLFEVQNG